MTKKPKTERELLVGTGAPFLLDVIPESKPCTCATGCVKCKGKGLIPNPRFAVDPVDEYSHNLCGVCNGTGKVTETPDIASSDTPNPDSLSNVSGGRNE